MAHAPHLDPRRPRRRPLWIALALLGVGILGYFLAAPLLQPVILRAQLATETAAALQTARPTADAAHAEWLEAVSPALGLDPKAAYTATYDICYVDHNDGGWVALSYNQKCQLSYVDFFELPASNAAVDAAVHEATSSASGPQTSAAVYVDDYLKAAGRRTDRVPADMPFTISATLPGTSDARAAVDEWMLTGSDVVAYAAADAFANRELLSETGRFQLDPATQYLVVSDSRAYYEKDIGCATGRPVFCSSPLGGD